MKHLTLALLPLLLVMTNLQAQDGFFASIMFYNVENLFDTEDDPVISDDEFLPGGLRRWSHFRFQKKLAQTAKVIVNTGSWVPPAFIGLCEIENRFVLERLVSVPTLKNWNYQIIHKDSPDDRGIDVAAVYRPDVFYPLTYSYFPPVADGASAPGTREILYVMGVLDGVDTVHLFVNHWPSRYGGLMETRPLRQKAASRLASEIMRLQEKYVNPVIIITGDFNDQPDDDSMTGYLGARLIPGTDSEVLYNLSYAWQKAGLGTLKHQALWNVFDQFVVSGSLLNHDKRIFSLPEDAVIMDAAFLLTKDDRYLGQKLFRTYEGYRYTGGYSDHLPVLLKIRKKE